MILVFTIVSRSDAHLILASCALGMGASGDSSEAVQSYHETAICWFAIESPPPGCFRWGVAYGESEIQRMRPDPDQQARIYFSDYFGVSTAALSAHGAFNISLVSDLPLMGTPSTTLGRERCGLLALYWGYSWGWR